MENIAKSHYSIEAEQAVLGALLFDNAALDVISDVITREDFYDHYHSNIYKTIQNIVNGGEIADELTVASSMEFIVDREDPDQGMPYLQKCLEGCFGIANARKYSKIVLEKSVLRKIAALSMGMYGDTESKKTSSEIIASVQEEIQKLLERQNSIEEGFKSFKDLLNENVSDLQELYANKDIGGISGLETGIKELDDITNGFQNSELIIVAGRPSMGKTALCMNIAEHVAVKVKKTVAVFSMEMQDKSLSLRTIGSNARINSEVLRSGHLEDNDWEKLSLGVGRLSDCPIYIDDTAALNAYQIASKAKALKKRLGDIGLIVIDYLQLMASIKKGKNNDTRANELAETTRALKQLAKELQCPIVVLSQLNRDLEKRPNKRPQMSDLRESGAIEQDADLILFIYRDEVYNETTEHKGIAEIIIGKQRNGRIGTVRTAFIGEYTRFENLKTYGDAYQSRYDL